MSRARSCDSKRRRIRRRESFACGLAQRVNWRFIRRAKPRAVRLTLAARSGAEQVEVPIESVLHVAMDVRQYANVPGRKDAAIGHLCVALCELTVQLDQA